MQAAIKDDELIGKRYRLLRKIGSGTFSNVYLAEDEKRRAMPFAVKVLKPELIDDEDLVNRFLREIQLTQLLQHPNIVSIYSSGRTIAGLPYLVSEYCALGDLEAHLNSYKDRRPPFFRLVNLLRFISRALAHAHKNNVLHRDIKPQNVLLTPSLNVKLADFGIGSSLLTGATSHEGELIGTPHYMAPEQFEGTDIGPWTDVYALGILGYQIIMGELPFQGEVVGRVIYQHCNTPTPNLLFKGSGIPCWMEDLIHKACEKDQNKRFQDAGEFNRQLENCFRLELQQARPLHRWFYVIRPSGKVCTFLTERGIPRKTLDIAGISCGFLLVIGVVFAVWSALTSV